MEFTLNEVKCALGIQFGLITYKNHGVLVSYGLIEREVNMNKMLKAFALLLVAIAITGGTRSLREETPLVRYISPKNDSTVDLTGQKTLRFMWKPTPIPSGGRLEYKFELFTEFSYEQLVNETLDIETYSIEVPADKFENGKLYSWQVSQRDRATHNWSRDNCWSFTAQR